MTSLRSRGIPRFCSRIRRGGRILVCYGRSSHRGPWLVSGGCVSFLHFAQSIVFSIGLVCLFVCMLAIVFDGENK